MIHHQEFLDSNQKKPTLLIVDDQVLVVRQLHSIFKDDFNIFMANSGEEGIERCKEILPDLVLLDISMHGLDGFQVCEKIKSDALTSHIPIIFVTAKMSEEDEVKGFEMGAVDFIRKPINGIVTWARVHNHIQLKRQSDFLRSLALIDGLTGLSNRHHFDNQISVDWLLCAREKMPFSVLMIDVDFFKRFNDEFGHQAGDEALRSVAREISQQIHRPTDLAARYGGEEFAVVLPNTDLIGAEKLAQNVRRSISALKVKTDGIENGQSITVSIGVATTVPKPDTSYETIIEAADEQLYLAKAAGRNQVKSASPEVVNAPK